MAATLRKPSVARSADSIYEMNPFGFEKQTSFYATQHLLQNRSDSFVVRSPPKDNDIWKRPPPDFRIQVYEPNPPPRNTRASMQPWRYGPNIRYELPTSKSSDNILPKILQHKRPQSPKIKASGFNIPRPFEAKILYVKHGMFPAGKYTSPKPHDHRGYVPIKSLGLSEFETAYDPDPYGIHFKTRHLDGSIYHTDAPPPRDTTGPQMGKPLPHKLKWDAQLIHPKEQWPNKNHETTRHRRKNRSVYSALMERVEDKLNAKWAKEKLDEKLAEHEKKEKHRMMQTA